mmetsp:Transcript_105784/g.336899  ORF Transcript_105784/g.336899 Transcript_105784/m.336899 type:complete len:306 (+) Transcript_105784:227-1144(+)
MAPLPWRAGGEAAGVDLDQPGRDGLPATAVARTGGPQALRVARCRPRSGAAAPGAPRPGRPLQGWAVPHWGHLHTGGYMRRVRLLRRLPFGPAKQGEPPVPLGEALAQGLSEQVGLEDVGRPGEHRLAGVDAGRGGDLRRPGGGGHTALPLAASACAATAGPAAVPAVGAADALAARMPDSATDGSAAPSSEPATSGSERSGVDVGFAAAGEAVASAAGGCHAPSPKSTASGVGRAAEVTCPVAAAAARSTGTAAGQADAAYQACSSTTPARAAERDAADRPELSVRLGLHHGGAWGFHLALRRM